MVGAMAENPELEALIAKDPDDVDGYLVYGDWLEAEGDPRGVLVALQAAQLRGARGASRAIDEHIGRHRKALLGEFAGYTDELFEVEWRLGFFDRVCLRESDAKTLTALLQQPSARFIRRLELVPGAGQSAADHVNVLLETKRPATLRDLRIGGWSLDGEARKEELLRAFPRLEHSLGGAWKEILAAVGKARKASSRFVAEALPSLTLQPGVTLEAPIDAATVMSALRLEIDKDKMLGVVPALRRTFTPESLDAFMVAVAEQFAEMGEPSNHRWGFLALGALGGDGAAAWMGGRMDGWSHQRATQGAELLARIGTGLALYELYAVATDTNMPRAHRRAASATLDTIVRERSAGLESLLDRVAPTHAPGDALGRTAATIARRLERHMISGHRLTPHDFRHYVAEHPLVQTVAARVVWAMFDGAKVTQTFRIVPPADESSRPTFVDAADVPVALARTIGVVHPAELSSRKQTATAWKSAFERARLVPLFDQLERPVFDLREQEGGPRLGRFKLRRVDYARLAEVLVVGRDWEPFGAESRWDREDEDGIGRGPSSWGKSFERDRAWVVAALDDTRRAMAIVTARTPASQERRFDQLHPVTVSEILYDLETAVPHEDARERPPKPSREEVAELEARSGVKKGSRVRLGIRASEGKGKWGVVFWIGERDGGVRCGIKTDDDETIWADVAVLEKVSAEEIEASAKKAEAKKAKQAKVEPAAPRAELAKGDRVRWRSGNASGTGKVFWLGPGKFGGGPRAGVKDDDTGETIWTEVASCEPIDGT